MLMQILRRRVALAAMTLVLALPGAALASTAPELPMEVQVPLLLKALSYDRALARAGGEAVVLAVLYDAANAASANARTAFTRAVRSGAVKTIGGRPIRLVEINVAAGQTEAALRGAGAVAAYLTPGLEARVAAVVRAGTGARVTLLSGSESYVRQGVAVGVANHGGKPRLLVNLPQARAAGADLPAPLLQIATVLQ